MKENPEFELDVEPRENQRSPKWWEDYRRYHKRKRIYAETQRLRAERSRRRAEDVRDYYEAIRQEGKARNAAKVQIIADYAWQYNLSVMVETGTFQGDTSAALMDTFEQIHTVEIEPDLFQNALQRFQGTNVTPHHGNSGEVLETILGGAESTPVLFWLDAHWCEEGPPPTDRLCPAEQELNYIFTLPSCHVILIDDARFFQRRGERDSAMEGYPTTRWIYDKAMGLGYDFAVEDDIIRLTPQS